MSIPDDAPTGKEARDGPETELAQVIEVLRRVDKRLRSSELRLGRVEQQLEALLRHSVDPALRPVEPQFLLNYHRFRITSQNGEDGMLAALVAELNEPVRRFVEIGCGGNGGNSGFFAGELGWAGLMVDQDRAGTELCRKLFGHNPRVRITTARVTPENVDDLIRDAGMEGEIDYLSLDIDSTDFWVLKAMTACDPRILVLEYNAYFGTDRSIAAAPDASFADAPKGYYGASLSALTKLAAEKGYRLLACEEAGVNAIYLRNDIRPDIHGVDAALAFRPIKTPEGRRHEGKPRDARRVFHEVERSGLPLVQI